jgi:assimilatory nitrate reductase electron transfer subunit
MRLVVIGHGMVGARFVEEVIAHDAAGKYAITVLGAEDCEPYNRVLLSDVVAGRTHEEALGLGVPVHDRLVVHRGTSATLLDREDRAVVTADGRRHRYDQLVLATGASARVPEIPGLRAQRGDRADLPLGAHPCARSTTRARSSLPHGTPAAPSSSGPVCSGVEVAAGLAARGCQVTLVHPSPTLMERQLDATASEVLTTTLSPLGVDTRVGVGATTAIVATGRVTGLRLSDGSILESDLLVLATGTTPNTQLAREARLPCDRGILVGSSGATTADQRVFAIGDCAQPPGGGTGLVAQGWAQARTLARHLTGHSAAPDRRPGHRARRGQGQGAGLHVMSLGIAGLRRDNVASRRTITLSDPAAGRHLEVVVDDGRLVGAIAIGDPRVAADLIAAYTRPTPLPVDPALLLLPAAGVGTVPTPRAGADLPGRGAGLSLQRSDQGRHRAGAPGRCRHARRDRDPHPCRHRLRRVRRRRPRAARVARCPRPGQRPRAHEEPCGRVRRL